MQSDGTYGQLKPNFPLTGLGRQNYLNLRDNVKTVLVTQEEDDWIFNLNIGNVMHLQPLSAEEMNLHVDNSHELSRDAMLEKIILLTVSYFCVGTELRFLNNNQTSDESQNKLPKEKQVDVEREKKRKKEHSEMWHAQALEASARFLPSECPLVAHVITNYQKHHSPALTTIPEDEPLEEDLKVIRPLNEVKNDNINYYQIIRNHLKPEPKESRVKQPRLINSKESEVPKPNPVKPEAIKSPENPALASIREGNAGDDRVDDRSPAELADDLVNETPTILDDDLQNRFSPDHFNHEFKVANKNQFSGAKVEREPRWTFDEQDQRDADLCEIGQFNKFDESD